jgi:hypothetical protein
MTIMSTRSVKLVLALTLMAALFAGAISVQAARERAYPVPVVDEETLTLTSGSMVRRLSLAFTGLAADLYWIRAIQYYGSTKRKLEAEFPARMPPPSLVADPTINYPLLYPLLDLTTTLDPRFNVAYRFGAIFLAEPSPSGPERPDLAVALLEKGLRERPDKWEYMEDIGFVHYWYRRDYPAAAAWFDKAGRVAGAPWWLKSLAATTLAQGGDRQSSRQMWTAIRESAEIDWLRNDAERRLLQLRALDEIDALQQRVNAFAARTGLKAVTWPMLARAGVVPGNMADPTGTPYELTSDGLVRLSQRSRLWPPPEEPQSHRRPTS